MLPTLKILKTNKTAHLQARTIGIATFVWPAGVLDPARSAARFACPPPALSMVPPSPPLAATAKVMAMALAMALCSPCAAE